MSLTTRQRVMVRLGIPPTAEVSNAEILAAFDEVLAERYEPLDSPTPAASAAPGVVAIPATELDQLRTAAAIPATMAAETRAATVRAAVVAGRIQPAQAATWDRALEIDGSQAARLAALPKGAALPLEAVGYTGGVDVANDDDRLYGSLFGKG